MKNLFILMLIAIFVGFAYSEDLSLTDLSDFLNSSQAQFNIYNQVSKFYSKSLKNIDEKAFKELAQKYNTTPEIIKNILIYGEVLECNKIDKFKTLSKENLDSCYFELQENFNFQKLIIFSTKSLQTTQELMKFNLADGDKKNGPYDLIVDLQKISNMLFKKGIKKEKITYGKVNMKPELLKKANIADDIIKDFFGPNTPTNSTQNQNSANLTTATNSSKQTGTQNSNTNLTTNNQNQNSINSTTSNSIFSNPNFQIGNSCNNTNQTNTNKNNSSSQSNIQYTPITNLADTSLNSNSPDAKAFDVFGGEGSKGALIANSTGINSLLNPLANLQENTKKKIKDLLQEGKPVCGADDKKILSVCLQLIPSGPRGPVGGTTRVNSVQDIITKIDDVLKDIKQSFIIPAGHGDEALDIDFKHIDFASIMSFDIVLTKKPVFQYKKNDTQPDGTKKGNEKDTQNCPNIPRYLANLYGINGIASCNSSQTDINKYLISNLDNAKFPASKYSVSYQGTNDISKPAGEQNLVKNFQQIIQLTTKMFKNLGDLMKTWQKDSEVLKIKSE